MPSTDYKIVIEPLPLDEGGGFMALIPELPGCMSDGETEAKALINAEDAIACWIAHAEAKGETAPEPRG